jgi:hypothetical protein
MLAKERNAADGCARVSHDVGDCFAQSQRQYSLLSRQQRHITDIRIETHSGRRQSLARFAELAREPAILVSLHRGANLGEGLA